MLNIQGTGSPQQHIPILLNNCTIFQPAHSIRCYKTSHQAPILQLQIQQGTTSAILTQGQILSPRNIIVVASNAVGAVDHQMTDDDGGWLVFGAISVCPSLPLLYLFPFCGQNLLCLNTTTFLIFFHSVLCMLCNQRSCCIWTSSIWFCVKTSRGGCGALFSNIKSTSPLWHVACVL
uniref:Uncharacterized protein n=2 Tax=Meloidogyne TaxID=189290 RepID=A0A6V7WU91_MELEN|nr:unnamed protein product [Meloidogyne enterolobii]